MRRSTGPRSGTLAALRADVSRALVAVSTKVAALDATIAAVIEVIGEEPVLARLEARAAAERAEREAAAARARLWLASAGAAAAKAGPGATPGAAESSTEPSASKADADNGPLVAPATGEG